MYVEYNINVKFNSCAVCLKNKFNKRVNYDFFRFLQSKSTQ